MSLWSRIKARFGLIVLLLVVLLAALRVFSMQSSRDASGKKIIRLVHWQMESGVRDALDEVAREYEKLHPDVLVQQIVIGERGYGAWVTTRLIGRTAPDIVAMGQIDEALILPLFQRYFLPLSGEIEKPNPYNAGTSLEGVPWKNTYYDDMVGGYVPKLLEYYSVPSSAHTLRLFYNKALFKAATGLDAPPANFREFIVACEAIKKYGRQKGTPLIPIAGSGRFNTKFLLGRFDQAVNSTLLAQTDLNSDGEMTSDESLVALVGGQVSFDDPRVVAMLKGRDYYNKEFQPAFFSADRMDAAFLFLQQRALMIASGSWDAASYAQQADFPIGVCDFPLPGRDDPEFGRFVEGPAVEVLQGGFMFSVNRLSPNVAAALDFLRFLSSQRMNALLNQRIKWIPMIRGNKPDPFIKPFWPNLDGVKPGLVLGGGPRNDQELDKLLNLQAAGRLSSAEVLEKYRSTYLANADRWMREDVARNGQLAATQDEFAKILSRETSPDSGKDILILEGQIAREHDVTEIEDRYEDALRHTPLSRSP